ncbi:hypothetical protein ES703_103635 [subsurface metagenome]
MEDPVRALKQRPDRLKFGNVRLVNLQIGMLDEVRQILRPPGGEIVQHCNAIAITQQLFHQVATDKTGTTGHNSV